jgi:hypothetical protein
VRLNLKYMTCPEGRMEVSCFGIMIPFKCKLKKKGKCEECKYGS